MEGARHRAANALPPRLLCDPRLPVTRRAAAASAPSSDLFPPPDAAALTTQAPGPTGSLPLTDEMLRSWSSGDLFGLTQSAGMGWAPDRLLGDQYLIPSTQGGVREPD